MLSIQYNSKDVGKRLKELRISKHMSRVQLASKLNLSEDSVAGFEKGRTTIGAEHLVKIGQLFNISAGYFYVGNHKKLEIQEDISSSKWLQIFAKLDERERKRAFAILENVFPECSVN